MGTNMQTTFRERLLKVLAEIDDLGLSNFVLSQQMGKSKSYLGNILSRPNSKPPKDLVTYFEVRFNINPVWLCEGRGNMFLPGGRTNNLTDVSYVLKFRSLPKDQQKVILDLIDTCYKYVQLK